MLNGFHFDFLFWNYFRIQTFMPPSDAVEDEIFHWWFTCAPSICLHRPELHQCYPFCCKHVEHLPFWFLVLKLQQNSFFHATLHPGMEGGMASLSENGNGLQKGCPALLFVCPLSCHSHLWRYLSFSICQELSPVWLNHHCNGDSPSLSLLLSMLRRSSNR